MAALGRGDDDPQRGKGHIPAGKIEPGFEYLQGEEAEEEEGKTEDRKTEEKGLAESFI